MAERPWEVVVAELGDACWDPATELVSMIADDAYPSVLRDDLSRELAASTVVQLLTDSDYRRCIEELLAATPVPEAKAEQCGCFCTDGQQCPNPAEVDGRCWDCKRRSASTSTAPPPRWHDANGIRLPAPPDPLNEEH